MDALIKLEHYGRLWSISTTYLWNHLAMDALIKLEYSVTKAW